MKRVILLLAVILCSCTEDMSEGQNINLEDYQCIRMPIKQDLKRKQLINSFDNEVLAGIAAASAPDSLGAMGRNKKGYFHVRFQLGISALANYAVYSQDLLPLELCIKATEYAFQHQLANGSFTLVIPSDLADQSPKEEDLASGVAFFLSSLGLAINSLEESEWYHSGEVSAYKQRIQLLKPNIESAANWLLSQKAILENGDGNAPNRLFYDALAFYSLGKWLNREDLKSVGIYFANLAMKEKKAEGYFLEGSGWDSSYQGVATHVGFNLFSLLEEEHPIRQALWDTLSCAVDWQKSRILPTGEISSEGNTRVYPGGETFLGREKDIDWSQTMLSFFMMSYYSSQSSFHELGVRVLEYYN